MTFFYQKKCDMQLYENVNHLIIEITRKSLINKYNNIETNINVFHLFKN